MHQRGWEIGEFDTAHTETCRANLSKGHARQLDELRTTPVLGCWMSIGGAEYTNDGPGIQDQSGDVHAVWAPRIRTEASGAERPNLSRDTQVYPTLFRCYSEYFQSLAKFPFNLGIDYLRTAATASKR